MLGDVLLALYIMYEANKGSSSFYYPYIQTLPQPDTITDWKVESKSNGEECRQKDVDELLKMFEDDSILLKVKQRQQFLQVVLIRFGIYIYICVLMFSFALEGICALYSTYM